MMYHTILDFDMCGYELKMLLLMIFKLVSKGIVHCYSSKAFYALE